MPLSRVLFERTCNIVNVVLAYLLFLRPFLHDILICVHPSVQHNERFGQETSIIRTATAAKGLCMVAEELHK